MKKLENIKYGIEDKRGHRTTTVEQSDIEDLAEKINEIIDWINKQDKKAK